MRCEQCGAPVASGAGVCPYCGAPFDAQNEETEFAPAGDSGLQEEQEKTDFAPRRVLEGEETVFASPAVQPPRTAWTGGKKAAKQSNGKPPKRAKPKKKANNNDAPRITPLRVVLLLTLAVLLLVLIFR